MIIESSHCLSMVVGSISAPHGFNGRVMLAVECAQFHLTPRRKRGQDINRYLPDCLGEIGLRLTYADSDEVRPRDRLGELKRVSTVHDIVRRRGKFEVCPARATSRYARVD